MESWPIESDTLDIREHIFYSINENPIKMETTTAPAKPITEMSAAEIKEFLAQKEAAELNLKTTRKKAYQIDKDNFLNLVLEKFTDLKGILAEVKKDSIQHAENFNILKYELDEKTPKEAKSFELKNNNVKIIVESQERFDFTDEAVVHIQAIKDIFREKFEQRNKGFYALLDGILMKNGKGDYDAKLLTKARRQVKDLGDERLIAEFDKLNDCLIVVGSTKYIRVYEMVENKWKDVSLNFSSI